MQDKIDYNKINEIREERNANSIYNSSATSRAAKIIPTLEIISIHTDNESSIHVEHFYDIKDSII